MRFERLGSHIYKIKSTQPIMEKRMPVWASAICLNAHTFQFHSIKEAQRFLSPKAKYFDYLPTYYIRRGHLIFSGLRMIPAKKWHFQTHTLVGPLAFFTLLSAGEGIIFPDVHPVLPLTYSPIKEFKEPPSRAYLKLSEVFLRKKTWPQSFHKVLELGSSPGGWTWLLSQLGCSIECIDKGTMSSEILNNKNVTWHKTSAFSWVKKHSVVGFDWLFSDMACSPEKLLDLIEWTVQQNPQIRIVATIKLNRHLGNWNQLIEQFLRVPNAEIIHLYHNKHELTFLRLKT
ncbi:MAG: hypothetical protein NZ480_07020 [Bdellovibrionaceae bacterium]|nr:hypothetical protein [Pseudobdellovibrionaceae bacterium]MDW8189692.1 SAM-dependent methyltransferase [Pseudobdellovibrionaceae bacterium]